MTGTKASEQKIKSQIVSKSLPYDVVQGNGVINGIPFSLSFCQKCLAHNYQSGGNDNDPKHFSLIMIRTMDRRDIGQNCFREDIEPRIPGAYSQGTGRTRDHLLPHITLKHCVGSILTLSLSHWRNRQPDQIWIFLTGECGEDYILCTSPLRLDSCERKDGLRSFLSTKDWQT